MRTVFSTFPAKINNCGASLQYIQEAKYVIRNMHRIQDKRDYFASIGLHYDNVQKYYDKVISFNRLLAQVPKYHTPDIPRYHATTSIKAIFQGCILVMRFFLICIFKEQQNRTVFPMVVGSVNKV